MSRSGRTLAEASVTRRWPTCRTCGQHWHTPCSQRAVPCRTVGRRPHPQQPQPAAAGIRYPTNLDALAASLAEHGLLQPVVVRRVDDHYELIAGERRLRAAKQAGWSDVPVHVVEADDRQVAELAIVENLQRKDSNPLEKAASFQRYLQQYACTQEELAGRLKLDRSTIANLIRLLGTARGGARGHPPRQDHAGPRPGAVALGRGAGADRPFAGRIQREGLSVRQTESMVQEMIQAADRGRWAWSVATASTRRRRGRSEHLAALEQEFRTALGCG